MLVLTRKVGEEIIVGGNVRIQIVEINGGKVRIGIVAPREITIDRMEVHAKRTTSLPIELEEKVEPEMLLKLEQIRTDVATILNLA